MQMISMYRSRGPNLYPRQKFIFEARINISGEEAQNLLEKLKYPIIWRKLHSPFDNDRVVLDMTIAELDVYMKDFAIEYFYRRIGVLKSRPKVANPKKIRVISAGSDMYECRCAWKSSERTTPALRKSFSIACGRRATFGISFSAGYYHTENKELNLAVHADKRVIVTWSWKHHHDFHDQEFFRKLSLSKMAREALKEAVLEHGPTGSQIRHMREVVRTKSKESSTWELMKVKNRHLRYILSQNP